MKLSLKNALLLLLAGLLVIGAGSFLDASRASFSHPVILTGLFIEFLGSVWLVLTLNQRRRKHR